MEYDVRRVRSDFPCLDQEVRDRPLVYLDSAATAQRPSCVIGAVERYYSTYNASVHRGVHALAARATDAFEGARRSLQGFVNARSADEIVVTKGCTEALNLVASSYGSAQIKPGDQILVSTLEHHSNIVPWQMAAQRSGAVVRPIPIDDAGVLDLEALDRLLRRPTAVVAVNHVSNALGTINPVKEIATRAHRAGAIIVVDGAQAGPHMPIDVQALDADFYAISGHKMYGPTGVGVLYGKLDLLRAIPPYQGGGSMIHTVTFEKTTYAEPPAKFEAGTPPIAEFIGLGAAAEYVLGLGRENIVAHEHEVLEYGRGLVGEVEGVRIVGNAPDRCGILSFVIDGVHPHDVGTVLDTEGIAVRAGHHCAQPLMDRLGLAATVRASLGMYSTKEEMEVLVAGIRKVKEVFL
ncbi:MAG: cysteine desulfurase [Armatimonadetes bacterium]|nr:cysteine desulfurase [Armatimonadota bacterium]